MLIQEEVASKIRGLIKAAGLQQNYVAQKAGYEPKRFSAMLNGRIKIQVPDIPRIAKALNTTPNFLFGFQDTA